MIRGLYSSANGLLVHSTRTDVIAGNLSAIGVPGYRRDIPTVSAFARTLRRTAAGGAAGPPGAVALLTPATHLDLRPASLHHTGGKLDLALDGPGYFAILTPAGEAYTRGGAFRLDAAGSLLTASGEPVLGQTGPIRITGADVQITDSGDLIVDGARVDRLRLVAFPPHVHFHRLGGGLLQPAAGTPAPLPLDPATRVRQRYLEDANVNAVRELAAMIAALRSFEASQRALHANDETLRTAIEEIARV